MALVNNTGYLVSYHGPVHSMGKIPVGNATPLEIKELYRLPQAVKPTMDRLRMVALFRRPVEFSHDD